MRRPLIALLPLFLVACDDHEPADDAGLDASESHLDATTARDGARDASIETDAAAPIGRRAARVFFVGHSLVNFHMPAMLDVLARAAGLDHTYGSQIGIGAPLSWIWENPETTNGDDAHVALPTGDYDVLVLTELIPVAEHVRYNDTVGYAARFADLALAANPDTQIYVYETWYQHGDPEWLANIARDRAIWESIARELDARVSGPPVLLVPGGTALARLVERIESGEVEGLASRADLFVDDIHLNDLGNYFIALVQLATIYGTSPVGLPNETVDRYGQPFRAPSPAAARVMQETAWEVVSRDPGAGVVTPGAT